MADRVPESHAAMRGHRCGGWFRDRRWFSRTPVDDRPYFEATTLFQARDLAQAEFLFDAMIDGLGCPQQDVDGNHVCPHFRFGAVHQLDDGGSSNG